ncbi:MAG: aspartyl/glutamyl-tRNA amidotransferase subunit C [Anaerolineales bacterium]
MSESIASRPDEAISKDVFDHLVGLAQFELSADEGEYLRRELNGQMESIRQLGAIELGEDIPIASHGVPYELDIRPPVREDEIEPSTLADAIVERAPETEDRFIVVPDIPHEELE